MKSKSRQELVLEDALAHKEYQCYCPVRPAPGRKGSRREKFYDPIFPGYVFVNAAPDRIEELKYIEGSCGLLVFGKKAATIKDEEIENIRLISRSPVSMNIHFHLQQGDSIKVISGPLSGLDGVLIRFNGKSKVVLNVPIFNQSVSTEIDLAMIRKR